MFDPHDPYERYYWHYESRRPLSMLPAPDARPASHARRTRNLLQRYLYETHFYCRG